MIQSLATVPGTVKTVVRSGKYGVYNQVQRDVTTTWVLNPEAHAEGSDAIRVSLTTSHRGESKQFSSVLTWDTLEAPKDGSVFSVSRWSSDHPLKQIHRVSVARYSVKAMEAHHAVALDVLEQYWDEGVSSVFSEALAQVGFLVES